MGQYTFSLSYSILSGLMPRCHGKIENKESSSAYCPACFDCPDCLGFQSEVNNADKNWALDIVMEE